jgi:hypothetical protein
MNVQPSRRPLLQCNHVFVTLQLLLLIVRMSLLLCS